MEIQFGELESEIVKELSITDSSVYEFEKTLRKHSLSEAKYYSFLALSTKRVGELELQIKVLEAEITEKNIKDREKKTGKPVPIYSISDIRKTYAPLSLEYQGLVKEFNEEVAKKQYFFGIVRAFSSRDHRLTELSHLTFKYMQEDHFTIKENVNDEKFENTTKNLEY